MTSIRPTTADKFRRDWPRFKTWLLQNGSEIRVPTNDYELARFTTTEGVGVVYRDGAGRVTSLTGGASEAWDAWKAGTPWQVGNRAKRNRRRNGRIKSLIERDGDCCFFCGRPLGDDITLEHLVAVAHGGPDHLSNLVLAHAACNQRADHLSVAEKVRLREGMQLQQQEAAA